MEFVIESIHVIYRQYTSFIMNPIGRDLHGVTLNVLFLFVI